MILNKRIHVLLEGRDLVKEQYSYSFNQKCRFLMEELALKGKNRLIRFTSSIDDLAN